MVEIIDFQTERQRPGFLSLLKLLISSNSVSTLHQFERNVKYCCHAATRRSSQRPSTRLDVVFRPRQLLLLLLVLSQGCAMLPRPIVAHHLCKKSEQKSEFAFSQGY